MLNLKKVIASICVIALMLSTVAFAATYTDVAVDSAYYEAVETLSKLGIVTGYEDGSYKPEETVTRAEMAALIARIQGYDETAKANADTIFTDVPKAHWASGYVAQAANQGIINGYGDGTFGPEDAVTYEQAVKMIMATLGYTPYANFNGGYPTGYLTAATRYGVADGVSNAVVGSGANRGTIAQLLNNAIDTALMVQSNWSTSGDVEYVVYDGSERVKGEYRTLMSEYLGVVKLKGIVVENSVIDLDGTKAIKADKEAEVEVYVTDNFSTDHKDFQDTKEDYTFLVGESDAEDFIGKAVVLYVMETAEKADEYEVVAIAEDSARNKVITFTLDKFDDYKSDRIEYVENVGDDDPIYESFEKGDGAEAPVINYNGISTYALVDDKGDADETNDVYGYVWPSVVANGGLSVNGGLITLIDNDSVKGIDYILVEVAATAVVDEIEDGVVTFKEPARWDGEELYDIDFEREADDTIIALTKDGAEIAYTDLKEWDAISIIAKNDTGKGYIRAEVVSNAIEGKITAESKSVTSYPYGSAGVAFTIDGKKYDRLEGFGTTTLEAGSAGTFYIDKYGKIAAFNEDSSAAGASGSYAYILNMIAAKDDMGENALTFQLVTSEGIKEVELADRVIVNYPTKKKETLKLSDVVAQSAAGPLTDKQNTAKVFFNRPSNYTGNSEAAIATGVAIDTLVKYTLNTAGDVNTITVADYDEKKFDLVATPGADTPYDTDRGKLGSKYIDSDATVFFIDGKKSIVGTAADLEDIEYTVNGIYADSKAIKNNIVVISGGMTNIPASASAAIITDIATGLDAEGATIMTLSYVQNNEEVTGVATVETSELEKIGFTEGLSMGDVVKVKVNAAGNITRIESVIDFKEGGRNAEETANFENYVAGHMPVGISPVDGVQEFYGGPVAWAMKGGYVQFNTDGSLTIRDGEYTSGTGETEVYDLADADTISVIEFKTNSVVVKKGSASSFKVFEDLYDGVDNMKFVRADTDAFIANDGTDLTVIGKYTDHVFCRVYDGDLVEVVIVKAPVDVKVKAQ